MDGAEREKQRKEDILIVLGEVKKDVAVLNERYDNMEGYIFHDLKPDIERLCAKVEQCTARTAEGYNTNLKWMITALLTSIVAIAGWIAVLV